MLSEKAKLAVGSTAGLVAPAVFAELFDVSSTWNVECRRADGTLRWNWQGHNLVTTAGKNALLIDFFKPTPAITNIALTTNVVTITAANNFNAGDTVVVQANTNTAINGTFVLVSANSTTLTYNLTHANIGSTADTGSVLFAPTWYVGLVDNASFSAYAAADTMASHAGWIEGVPYSNGTRVQWVGGTVAAGSVDNSGSVAAFTINATLTVRGAFLCSNSTKSGTTGTLYCEADFGASRSVLSGDTLNVTVTLSVS